MDLIERIRKEIDNKMEAKTEIYKVTEGINDLIQKLKRNGFEYCYINQSKMGKLTGIDINLVGDSDTIFFFYEGGGVILVDPDRLAAFLESERVGKEFLSILSDKDNTFKIS